MARKNLAMITDIDPRTMFVNDPSNLPETFLCRKLHNFSIIIHIYHFTIDLRQ